jgi:hypothetical protein
MSEKSDYPPDQQRLIYKGSQLEDNLTLKDYKITNGTIIHMIPRLRGGATIDNIKDEVSNFFLNKPKNEFSINKNKDDNEVNIIFEKEEKNISAKKFEKGDDKKTLPNIISFNDDKELKNENIINIQNKEEQNDLLSTFVVIEKDEFNDNAKNNLPIDENDFNTNYLKREELHVNLIYFDLNMTNKENYIYFNNLKVDIIGGFHAIDDLNILNNYLEKIKNKDIPFIIISSGTSGKDVIKISQNYSFVKEVIIFCKKYEYNKHYIDEYPGYVKAVLTSIRKVYDYIKTFGADKYKEGIEKYLHEDKYIFSTEEIKMDKQLQQCPLISAREYDRCYFLVHKIYSQFFGDMNNKFELPKFKTENLNKILEYLNNFNFEKEKDRNDLINAFNKLVNIKTNDEFVEKSIREYTGETMFCYLFNRVMRNFEKGLISFAYYMGPFLYALNKYVKNNPNFAITKKTKLYRIIQCSNLDFYQYKLNLGHIICFPSITSTSSIPIKFKPTKLAKNININNEGNEMIKIKMQFKYQPKKGNISPGIIIEDKKAKDGNFLSRHPKEKEVILFPFTFAKISEIKSKIEEGNKIQVIKFEIINRDSYLEYTLRDNFEKRLLISKLEKK